MSGNSKNNYPRTLVEICDSVPLDDKGKHDFVIIIDERTVYCRLSLNGRIVECEHLYKHKDHNGLYCCSNPRFYKDKDFAYGLKLLMKGWTPYEDEYANCFLEEYAVH